MFILLRAVRMCAVLLTRAESGSESGLQTVGSETEGLGSMWKGQVKVQGSVSELINMLGGLEGLPA